ncbi:hypothetical protein D806_000750 [Mycolicibacterium smegmatis MKD8]|uniref:Uncharacterized protein n=2 Tax=Mycolicibacterium smegmatis TaxID=1772 RepID=A0A2U9PH74_MYCSE|nr:hypothetical protein MSMEG0069R [Mycolicibacterium smegmatis MKD8]AWT51069.1 hypothetical protein D806_000750 [Mycolicibacterium smegmatis MKD8]
MGTPDMRVEEGALGWDPAEVTVPAMPSVGDGPDPLSTIIATAVPHVATGVREQVGATRAREERFAENLASARSAYHSTDDGEKQRIGDAARGIANRANQSSAGSTGIGAFSSAAAVSGARQSDSQFGQLVSMAMQGGQQALQVPFQLAGMTGQLPQAVQGLVQQTAEWATKGGQAATGPSGSSPRAADLPPDSPTDDEDENLRASPEQDSDEQRKNTGSDASSRGAERAPVESVRPQRNPDLKHHRNPSTPPEVAL